MAVYEGRADAVRIGWALYAESVGEFPPRVAATLGFRFQPMRFVNSERVRDVAFSAIRQRFQRYDS